jgi:hypothetical protein
MSGNEHRVLRSSLLAMLATVGIGVVSIHAYGALGAAWTTCAGLILYNILLCRDAQRILGIRTWVDLEGFRLLFNHLRRRGARH